MRVLVTGGFGFIGSRLGEALRVRGHDVVLLDYRKPDYSIREIPDVESYLIDLTDGESLERLPIGRADVIVHLAGQPSAAASFRDPAGDLRANTETTVRLLEWGRAKGIRKFLYASTFNVYGEKLSEEPYSENDFCEPKSPYGVSKLQAEHYVRLLSSRYAIDWNVLRMFNIFGPGQDPTDPDHGMINIFLNQLRFSDEVVVKGGLDRYRDFLFIDDAVEAWSLCVESKKAVGQVFNVGSGVGVTVSDLIRQLSETLGKVDRVRIVEREGTPGDFHGSFADISRLMDAVGFRPRVSFKAGLQKFADWAGREDAQ